MKSDIKNRAVLHLKYTNDRLCDLKWQLAKAGLKDIVREIEIIGRYADEIATAYLRGEYTKVMLLYKAGSSLPCSQKEAYNIVWLMNRAIAEQCAEWSSNIADDVRLNDLTNRTTAELMRLNILRTISNGNFDKDAQILRIKQSLECDNFHTIYAGTYLNQMQQYSNIVSHHNSRI
jgi:hypothetical protein